MHKILVCCVLVSASAGVARAQNCPELRRELVDKLVDTRNAALMSPAHFSRKFRAAYG